MAKLADAPDLGSGAARHVGSTPIIRTAPALKGSWQPADKMYQRFKKVLTIYF